MTALESYVSAMNKLILIQLVREDKTGDFTKKILQGANAAQKRISDTKKARKT